MAKKEMAAGERLEQASEKGYIGTKVDPTPNEAYTVAGVTKGLATPETDASARREANEAAGLEEPRE